jgi:hypothetical protein
MEYLQDKRLWIAIAVVVVGAPQSDALAQQETTTQ